MTSQTVATAPGTGRMPRRRGIGTWPTLAGIAFTASWAAGLSVSSSSTTVGATGTEVLASYAGHTGPAAAQFLLTEGLASLTLATVAIAFGRAALRAGAGRSARRTVAAALAAAAIGLVQCALGLYLTGSVVPAGHAGEAAALSEAITRLDGAKMFLLAGMAVAGTVAARQASLLPRWLQWTGVGLAVAITVSGAGYALLISSLALAA